jgi:magnesium-transporting ATPase (P-type)
MVVVAETWYLFNVRRFTASGFTLETFFGSRVAIGTSALLLGLQALFLYLPVMNDLFGTAPLSGYVVGIIVSLGAGIFVIVEIEKWLWRRRGVISF